MRLEVDQYRAEPGRKVRLAVRPTQVEPVYRSLEDYQTLLSRHVETLSDHQARFYASGDASLLIIFQAMDAAGKDGAIKHVMSGLNPQGCDVVSFKKPGPVELAHDFMWRYYLHLPERGRIGVFNRSYYEEVLVMRVHPDLLQSEEREPKDHKAKDIFRRRFRSLRAFEKHLHANGTHVLKIFLHLSKDEQARRFLARMQAPSKTWKLSPADMIERQFWDDYQTAYEDAIASTTTAKSPWWIIPADDKHTSRLLISQILIDALAEFKSAPSKPDADVLKALASYQAELHRDLEGHS
jgi:PPK2 family polyphosphate:nucleotide phosphotransferase